MKTSFLLLSATLLPAGATSAAVFSASWNSGFIAGTTIPDGNATGWSDSRALSIPATEMVICGMALGYADPDAPINRFRTERISLADFVTWVDG